MRRRRRRRREELKNVCTGRGMRIFRTGEYT